MKAKVISQIIYEGMFAYVHGMGQQIKRILIPEANNLVITPHNDILYVWDEFKMDDYEVVKEIEVPDELVKEAIEFMNVKKKLFPAFRELIAPQEDLSAFEGDMS